MKKELMQISFSGGYMHIYDFNRESDKAKFERELGK